MNTQNRIMLLLTIALLLLAGSIFYNYYSFQQRQALYRADEEKQRSYSADLAIKTQGVYLDQFVYDYTYWTDLVDAISRKDTDWIYTNVGVNVENRDIDYIWTYNKQKERVYFNYDTTYKPLTDPIDKDFFTQILDTGANMPRRYVHFYIETADGIFQVSGSTIQHTDDPDRLKSAEGMFFIAAIVDSAYLHALGELTNAQTSIIETSDTLQPIDKYSIQIRKPIADFEGKPLMYYSFLGKNDVQQVEDKMNQRSLLIYAAIVVTVLVLLYIAFVQWVYRPLSRISRTLDFNDVSHIQPIVQKKDEFGNIASLIAKSFEQRDALVKEISARKQAEEVLRQSERRFKTLIAEIPDYILVLENERIVFINDAVTKNLGYTQLQAHNLHLDELVDGHKHTQLLRKALQDIAHGIPSNEFEVVLRDVNSNMHIALGGASPIEFDGKNAVLLVLVDITERVKTSNALRKTEESYKTLVANLGEGIVKIDFNEKFVFANAAAETIFGVPTGNLVNHKISDFAEGDDALFLLRQTQLKRVGERTEYEIEIERIDGEKRSIVVVATPNVDEEGKIVDANAIIQDITERKQLMQDLTEAKEEAEAAFRIIHQKNKNITDSITYAKKIQSALLAKPEEMNNFFAESFVFFRPKDIVSGDFYWFGQSGKLIYVVAADCTGHGVPGGFMSMLGLAFVNEIMRNADKIDAGAILDSLRHDIKVSLNQTGLFGAQKDGMDIAMCIFNTDDNTMQFAGAHNPVLIVRSMDNANKHNYYSTQPNFRVSTEDECESIEIYGDKQPIGIFLKERPFATHRVNVFKGDRIYMFTDGYGDQIGGERRRKFMSKNLKQLLVSIHRDPMNNQHDAIKDTIDTWQGNLDQIDDMLVMGVRL